jgi:IMP dehydrogenase
MQDIGKNDVTAEGESTLVPYKGSVVKILKDLTGGIRSGFTYSGSSNIDEFYNNSTFCEISHHSYIEGTPHLLRSVS